MAGTYDMEFVLSKCREYRNWGTWGPDDELGSANYVSEEKVAAAADLVRKGRVFSLALPLDSQGPMTGKGVRVNPQHFMLWDGGDIISGAQDLLPARWTDDAVYMCLQSSTQWDAFAHVFFEGTMYNGYGPEHISSRGANKNSITNMRSRAVGRGVLLDVARSKGKRWLDVSEPITGADLDACSSAQGVEVGEGDFVLVRTGQILERREAGSWGDYAGGPAPGLAISAADFLCPRHVASVATDTWGAEVLPNETTEVFQPLHQIIVVNAGIYIGEMWDMEDLAADCAEDGIYEFMLVAPPLTITGSVGSPVNPQAIK